MWAVMINCEFNLLIIQRDVVKSVKMAESVFFLTIAHVGPTGQDQPVNNVCILCKFTAIYLHVTLMLVMFDVLHNSRVQSILCQWWNLHCSFCLCLH